MIGKTLGPVLLGYYAFAYGMFMTPLIESSLIVGRVSFAAFARLQEDAQKLRQGFLMTTRYMAFFMFPALFGLFLVTPDLIQVLFGPKWMPAVPVLRMLLVAGILQAYGNIWTSVVQAMGRPDWLFKLSVVSACIYVPAFFIGLRWGIVGVAAGYTASTLVLVPVQFAMLQRLIGVGMAEYVGVLSPVALASAIMGGCVVASQGWLTAHGVHAPLRLAGAIAVGIVTYLVAILLVRRELVVGLVRIANEMRHPPRAVLAEEVP